MAQKQAFLTQNGPILALFGPKIRFCFPASARNLNLFSGRIFDFWLENEFLFPARFCFSIKNEAEIKFLFRSILLENGMKINFFFAPFFDEIGRKQNAQKWSKNMVFRNGRHLF